MVSNIVSSSVQVETIIKQGMLKKEANRRDRIKLWLNKSSEAKSFRSWLISRKMLSTLNSDKETEIIFDAVLKKYDEFNVKIEKEKVEVEMVDSWKGKSGLEFYEGFMDNIIVISHQKNKDNGEIEELKKEIPKENVNRMLFLIKKWQIGEEHSCYEVAEMMGFNWHENIWKERQKIYFPQYYYPLKVLEALGLIKYSGRGKVTRLK